MQTSLLEPLPSAGWTPPPRSCPGVANAPFTATKPSRLSARTGRIRVLVVDDHPFVRRGLASWLEAHPRLEMIGEAGDGREGIERARELNPDVVLMDLDMPRVNGLEATAALRRQLPHLKVLIFSIHCRLDLVRRAAQSGAHGYLLKEASLEELEKAVATVNNGGSFFGPGINPGTLRRDAPGRTVDASRDLTAREREVLVTIAEGLTNKEIALRLKVNARTIETHRGALQRKLGLRGVAALTKYAVARGLVTTSDRNQEAVAA